MRGLDARVAARARNPASVHFGSGGVAGEARAQPLVEPDRGQDGHGNRLEGEVLIQLEPGLIRKLL